MENIILQILFTGAIAIAVIFNFLQLWITRREINKPKVGPASGKNDYPPVTILKPLKGSDDQLAENLASFFELDYPRYEIILGLDDISDTALPVAQEVCKKYPHIRSRIIVVSHKTGLNPKINNLTNMYPFASYEYILISDSNVQVQKDYLTDLMTHLNIENTGLVTSSIRGTGARQLGAIFENLHLNSFIAASVFATRHLFQIPISIGKSMLMRREIIERIGGFAAFRNVLAEDHLIGEAVHKMGLEVRTSAFFINNVNHNWSLGKFINRHTRWAQMRKNINTGHYLAEILGNPVFLGMIYAATAPSSLSLTILGLVTILKILVDFRLIRLSGSDLKSYHALLIPVKDIIIGFIWMTPFFYRKINWRGNEFKITKQTQLIPINTEG